MNKPPIAIAATLVAMLLIATVGCTSDENPGVVKRYAQELLRDSPPSIETTRYCGQPFNAEAGHGVVAGRASTLDDVFELVRSAGLDPADFPYLKGGDTTHTEVCLTRATSGSRIGFTLFYSINEYRDGGFIYLGASLD